jgi:hypothetical protein
MVVDFGFFYPNEPTPAGSTEYHGAVRWATADEVRDQRREKAKIALASIPPNRRIVHEMFYEFQ